MLGRHTLQRLDGILHHHASGIRRQRHLVLRHKGPHAGTIHIGNVTVRVVILTPHSHKHRPLPKGLTTRVGNNLTHFAIHSAQLAATHTGYLRKTVSHLL